jgi:hypothetical protein
VSVDHARQIATDRILSSVREAIDTALRSHADEVAEAATDEFRRQATADLSQARDALRRQELARIDAEAQLAEARRIADEVRRAAELDMSEVKSAHEAALAAERLRADGEIEDARRAAQTTVEHVQRTADARLADLTRRLAESDFSGHTRSLVDALRSIDEAGSLSGVLERIMESARRAVGRVALLLVKGPQLQVWRSVGFDADGAPVPRHVVLDDGGLTEMAARQRRAMAERSGGAADSSGQQSAGSAAARVTAAFPITVAGDVVAVVYADAPADGTDDASPAWYHWMETLTIYAGRTLETLTIQLAMGFGSSLVQPSHERAASSAVRGGK